MSITIVETPGMLSADRRRSAPLSIDLMLVYHKANTSPVLKLFLSKVDEHIARVSKKHR